MADQVIGSMIGKLVGDSTHYIKELRHAESETKRATESMKGEMSGMQKQMDQTFGSNMMERLGSGLAILHTVHADAWHC